MLCMEALSRSHGTSLDVGWWLWTALTWIPVLLICTFFVPKLLADVVFFWFGAQLLVVPVLITARSIAKKDSSASAITKKKLTASFLKFGWIVSCPVLACLVFIPYLHLNLVPQMDRLFSACHQGLNQSCQQEFTNNCKKTTVFYQFPWLLAAEKTLDLSVVTECMKMKRLALEVTWILPVVLSILRPGPMIKQCFATKVAVTLYVLIMALEAMTLETYIFSFNITKRWEKYALATVIPVCLIMLNTEFLQHVGTFCVAVMKGNNKTKDSDALKMYRSWNCCIGAVVELMFFATRAALTVNRSPVNTTNIHAYMFSVFDWWMIKDFLMLLVLGGVVVYDRFSSSRLKSNSSGTELRTLV